MSQESENHSYFYDSSVITSNGTLPNWKRNYWQVNASGGNILLIIEAPSVNNFVQPGTIVIERLDGVRANTVTLRVISSGTNLDYDIPAYFPTFFYIFTACANPNGTADILEQISVPFVPVPISGAIMEGSINSSNYVMKAKSPEDKSNVSNDVVNYRTMWNSIRLVGDVVSDVNTATDINSSTVMTVGGKSSVQIAQSVTDTTAAASTNTPSTLVKRDSSGNFAASVATLSQVTLGGKATLSTQAVRFDQLPTVDTLNVYVSASGLDSNVGTVISPFLTLSKAESVVTGSGNIWLSTGNYSDSVTVTGANVLWSCPGNIGNYKATLTGTLTLGGSSVRRSFKGLQFSTGANQCVVHTSTQGIMNFENCGFISTNANPLTLGTNLNTSTFNYFRDCDFLGAANPIMLDTNISKAFTMTSSINSPNISLNSGTLTAGTFIISTAFPAGTVVLGNLGGNNWLLSRNATSSGSVTGYNAILWYFTNCSGLKLNIRTGHLVLGYNNPLISLFGNTINYLETANPLVTTVSTQVAMLAQTPATFGGIGFMTKVTSDATLANNGLWQCTADPIGSLANWNKIAGASDNYVAGAGITIDTGNVVRTSYSKMGADFTTSLSPQRVYRSRMWMSGSTPAARTWVPSQIPWVYADINAADLACIFWVQELTTFFKNMENDSQFDQLIGALPSYIVSRITGNSQVPDGSTDMDNNTGAVTAYASEWFEFIVGRNPAGTELYTMSFTFAQMSNPAFDGNALFPFRIIWQTIRGASMTGFSAQSIGAISSSQPRCSAYSSVTIPASGFPLWAIPVSIETTF